MTHILKLKGNEKVLEVGTGSGYQAAVLSGLCKDVYTSEVVGVLAESAKARLKKLDYSNVYVRFGNGEDVWRDKAPFDSIIITAGLKKIPGIFFDQLKVGGNLVAPVGSKTRQEMTKYTKDNKGEITKKDYGTYVFVSYVGKAKSK